MQIVNPLRTALPYITLQTAKVQRCWADYFIFRGFAGAAGRFGSAETRRRSLRQPPQAAGPAAPAPDFLQALKYSLQGTTQGNGLTGGVPPVRFSM